MQLVVFNTFEWHPGKKDNIRKNKHCNKCVLSFDLNLLIVVIVKESEFQSLGAVTEKYLLQTFKRQVKTNVYTGNLQGLFWY